METKHTPGEWIETDGNPEQIAIVPKGGKGAICFIPAASPNAKENAALIKCAPDMLQALKKMTKYLDDINEILATEEELPDPGQFLFELSENISRLTHTADKVIAKATPQ